MAANYVLLERIELNASASSVSFTNIPQSGYTDLKMVASIRMTTTNGDVGVYFNTAATDSSDRNVFGNGTSAASDNHSGQQSIYIGPVCNTNNTANTFNNFEMYIPNYTSSNQKSISIDNVQENNATASYATLAAGLSTKTAAINSITFYGYGGGSVSFAQYSTFSLYGLAAVGTTPVIAPKASGGNITTDGTYWIHTFLTSGTFTPATNLTCDYLVVAGGAGGASNVGGGGGAGGLRSTVTATGGGGSLETPLSLSATGYTVTVGAGGNGATSFPANGSSGSNSVFSTITATGGGYGGTGSGTAGTGGSGGGGSGDGGAGGANIANQGYPGGTGKAGGNYVGAGGGGAGAVGVTPANNTSPAGNGGAGVATSITGSSVTYAGGGGGATASGTQGTGGSGGGGNGSLSGAAGNGTTNTGSGGGGVHGSSGGSGGNGGSGIVVIRYLVA